MAIPIGVFMGRVFYTHELDMVRLLHTRQDKGEDEK